MGFKLRTKPEMIGEPDPSILLCPNIPKPLHGMAPRTLLGDEWWDKERKACYASTNHHCLACGVHASNAAAFNRMEAHEMYDYDYPKGTLTYVRAVPLCHFCHNYIHDGRMSHLLRKGEMDYNKIQQILKHGSAILARAGLDKMPYNGPIARWDQWRMIINGVAYKGKFASFDAWEEYYAE